MRRLAPLAPDAFLAWQWSQGDKQPFSGPLTVDDLWYEMARIDPSIAHEEVRRQVLGAAARVRRAQRLGENFWQDDHGLWWRVGG